MEEVTGVNCSDPPFTCLCPEQKQFRPKNGIGTNTYRNCFYNEDKSKSKVWHKRKSCNLLSVHMRTISNIRTMLQVTRPDLLVLLLYLVLLPCTAGYSLSPFSSPDLSSASGIWQHTAVLDEDGGFVVDWTPDQDQIRFQVTVNTRGYIGFGLSSKPDMDGADIVVGWVHSGKAYLQDRHGVGHEEPEVDSQQDWSLIAGYENDTHTSLIMSRPYNTCDKKDQTISNDTVHLLWAYHPDDPVNPENPHPRLHYHGWRRGTIPVFLLQRARKDIPYKLLPFDYYRGHQHQILKQTWFIRNPEVEINSETDTVYWCKLFKRPNLKQKHHIVKYEPVFSEGNSKFLQHMILYECTSLGAELDAVFEEMSMEPGQECYQSKMAHLIYTCNHVVAAWARGSEGMTFPPEAGYPLTPDGPKFYMMETHYDNTEAQMYLDSSGLKVTYTSQLRLQDAGVLSLGMDPDWKHLIPPKQRTVVSEGHCVGECTQSVLPLSGIHVFGTILHTHLLGRKVGLRHLRKDIEFEPIVEDNNYDVNYQEYRELQHPRHIRPGDHLITECVYNSRDRSAITLGGFKTRDEMCLSFLFYWPRVDLSFCHSKPSLSTVLHSLGIEELSAASNPITILHPEELRGKTLEWRLLNYNWKDNFEYFQWATSSGSFNPMCWRRGESLHPDLENVDYPYPNITEVWKPNNVCKRRRLSRQRKNKNQRNLSLFGDLFGEDEVDEVMFDDEVDDKPIERIDVDPYHHFGMLKPVYEEKLPPEEQFRDKNSAVISLGMEDKRKQQVITVDPDLEEELQEMEKSLEQEVLSRQYPQQSPTQHNVARGNAATLSIWSKWTVLMLLLCLSVCYIPNG
ncbi:unnamed protein product [Meganyctiphanes norvegica]|uniref:DOMON domain-containing protein n=1 Tax=Meganyctiphanes norvegica TaxID=48144 RepID=A0AAV2RLR3_MEGNR